MMILRKTGMLAIKLQLVSCVSSNIVSISKHTFIHPKLNIHTQTLYSFFYTLIHTERHSYYNIYSCKDIYSLNSSLAADTHTFIYMYIFRNKFIKRNGNGDKTLEVHR